MGAGGRDQLGHEHQWIISVPGLCKLHSAWVVSDSADSKDSGERLRPDAWERQVGSHLPSLQQHWGHWLPRGEIPTLASPSASGFWFP